jgi:signal transduction histidine kinase
MLDDRPTVALTGEPPAGRGARPHSRRTPPSSAVFLRNAGERFARSLELTETLQSMAELCIPHLGQACLIYLFREGLTDGDVAVVRHIDASRQTMLESLVVGAFAHAAAHELLVETAWAGRPAVLSQLKTAELIGDGRPAHVLQSDLQLKTAMLVPVADSDHIIGVVVCLAGSTRCYTPRLLHIAHELCGRFALAVAAAQLYAGCKTALDSTQELLATTIHDLMSPLTYIRGSAQRLRRLDWSNVDPSIISEFEKRLNAIDAAVGRMAVAMSSLMDSTRPKPNLPCRRPGPHVTDLSAVANEIVALEQVIAPDHRIHLQQNWQELLIGSWDPGDIQRMLANIIGNAVKYSPAGACVEVQLKSEMCADGRWAVVSVADQGIGIPSADVPFVFEPFRRGTNVGEVPGTGLGLASVWQIVRALSGELSVDSQEGKGTCFRIRLPLR